MPATNHFYTPTFVSGEKISLKKYQADLSLDFKDKTAIKSGEGDIEDEEMDWDDPCLSKIKPKLKKFDKGGGIVINCENLKEVGKLLKGKIKTVHLGGWISDDKVLDTVSL